MTSPASTVPAPERLAAVRRSGLLDTGPEEPFDRLTRLTCELLGAPSAERSLDEVLSDTPAGTAQEMAGAMLRQVAGAGGAEVRDDMVIVALRVR